MSMLVYLSFFILLHTRLLKIGAAKTALTTRSWNCCKHSCSWPGVGNVSSPVKTCDRGNTPLPLTDYAKPSSCNNPPDGGAYACAHLQPWQNNTISYGFAAIQLAGENATAWCCACYSLTFTSGLLQNRRMVVQAVSITTSASNNAFDLQVRMLFKQCLAMDAAEQHPLDSSKQ